MSLFHVAFKEGQFDVVKLNAFSIILNAQNVNGMTPSPICCAIMALVHVPFDMNVFHKVLILHVRYFLARSKVVTRRTVTQQLQFLLISR